MWVVEFTHEDCHRHGERVRRPTEAHVRGIAQNHDAFCTHVEDRDECSQVYEVDGVEVDARGEVMPA